MLIVFSSSNHWFAATILSWTSHKRLRIYWKQIRGASVMSILERDKHIQGKNHGRDRKTSLTTALGQNAGGL